MVILINRANLQVPLHFSNSYDDFIIEISICLCSHLKLSKFNGKFNGKIVVNDFKVASSSDR